MLPPTHQEIWEALQTLRAATSKDLGQDAIKKELRAILKRSNSTRSRRSGRRTIPTSNSRKQPDPPRASGTVVELDSTVDVDVELDPTVNSKEENDADTSALLSKFIKRVHDQKDELVDYMTSIIPDIRSALQIPYEEGLFYLVRVSSNVKKYSAAIGHYCRMLFLKSQEWSVANNASGDKFLRYYFVNLEMRAAALSAIRKGKNIDHLESQKCNLGILMARFPTQLLQPKAFISSVAEAVGLDEVFTKILSHGRPDGWEYFKQLNEKRLDSFLSACASSRGLVQFFDKSPTAYAHDLPSYRPSQKGLLTLEPNDMLPELYRPAQHGSTNDTLEAYVMQQGPSGEMYRPAQRGSTNDSLEPHVVQQFLEPSGEMYRPAQHGSTNDTLEAYIMQLEPSGEMYRPAQQGFTNDSLEPHVMQQLLPPENFGAQSHVFCDFVKSHVSHNRQEQEDSRLQENSSIALLDRFAAVTTQEPSPEDSATLNQTLQWPSTTINGHLYANPTPYI